jgi:hypothetical protein
MRRSTRPRRPTTGSGSTRAQPAPALTVMAPPQKPDGIQVPGPFPDGGGEAHADDEDGPAVGGVGSLGERIDDRDPGAISAR